MNDLNERLRKIEDRLSVIESKVNVQAPSLPSPAPSKQHSPFEIGQRTDTLSSPFKLWLKDNWLVIIGIFLVILAGGWFVHYAFAHDWIGKTTRVVFGFISGAILYFTGLWLMRKQPKGGQALIILGEAIAIIALFAGHQIYFILPILPTFLLMLAVVNFTAIIAIKNHLEGLGLSSIVFAAIIPMLINADSPNNTFLMLYVLIIDAVALWMWAMRGWGKTFHIAWVATFIYSFSLVTLHEPLVANFFAWAFYLIFLLPIAFSIYGNKLPSLPLKGNFILLTLTFAFIFWIDNLTQFPWNAISYFTAFLLMTTLGYAMAKNWNKIEPKASKMKEMLGTIIGFLVMALLFIATNEFTHPLFLYPIASDIQTLLYFIETAGAISISYFLLQSPTLTTYFSLSFIIPLVIVWENRVSFLYSPFLSLKFAILCAAIASLFIAAGVNRKALLHSEASPSQRLIVDLLWIMASIFAMILIWNICHHIFPTNNIARGIALVFYILAAETLIYVGNLKQLKNLRTGGIAIILFVVLRLLGEEVWKMPIIVRMITFIVIGLLLMGTSFFDKKNKHY